MIANPPPAASLTLEELIQRRDHLLEQIVPAVEEAELVIKKNPKDLDTALVLNLFMGLREINRQIVVRKQELKQQRSTRFRRCCGENSSTIIKVSILVTGAFVLLGLALSSWSIAANNDGSGSSCESLNNTTKKIAIGRLAKEAAEGIVLTTFYFGYNALSTENYENKLLSRVKRIESHGDENFVRVFQALDEIKKKDDVRNDQLIEALKEMEKLPSTGLSEGLSRSTLKSILIDLLPENNEIYRKAQILRLLASKNTPSKRTCKATNISVGSRSGTSSEDSTPTVSPRGSPTVANRSSTIATNRGPSPTVANGSPPTVHRKDPSASEESSPTVARRGSTKALHREDSSSMVSRGEDSFKGERRGTPPPTSAGAGAIRSALAKEGPVSLIDESPDALYNRLWSEFEEELGGIKFKRLQVGDVIITRHGIAPSDDVVIDLSAAESIASPFIETEIGL